MTTHGGSKVAVIAAIIGNLAIAIIKFIAAAITGSSAMISEGIHSLVDTGNGGLLLHGMKRQERTFFRMHDERIFSKVKHRMSDWLSEFF